MEDTKSESLNDQIESIYGAFSAQFPAPMEMNAPVSTPYIDEVYENYVIVCAGDKYYQVAFTQSEAGITFASSAEWIQVEEQTTYIPVKRGARNSKRDAVRLQTIHDYAVENGAMCDTKKNANVEEVVYFGNQVKAVKMDDGRVKFGGYLVQYGDPNTTDLTGDFFTADTDYGDASESDVYFNHRMPVRAGKKQIEYKDKLSRATLKRDERGIFAETILEARNEYEQMIIEAGLAGKLGWSSGTAGHLVDREQVGKSWHIKSWILGLDASLTPTPAEPRNSVIPLKSLGVTQDEATQAEQEKPEADAKPVIVETKSTGVSKMEIEETKLQEMIAQAAEAGALKAISATEPVKTSGTITVVEDEADRPFRTLAEQAQAVKDFTISYGRKTDPRLLRLINSTKAVQGASESVPSDGGILLEPTLTPEVLKPVHQEGAFSADVSRLPVGANSNSGWINGVDETSRATGSRWGGLRGYRLAEGDTVTKSKPQFRRIQWELKKYGVLVYDTNELLKDAAQFAAVVEQGAREELSFMLNDDIMNGLGVSGPQGVMQSGALVTVTRDTGSKVLGTDISAMWARLMPRSKANAKWYINPEVGPQLDALFAVGSTSVLFPYAGYNADGVRTLYGRPVVETEFNAALNTTGDIMLADMSQYLLWEKGGIDMATSMHVEFLTDQEVIRFIYRVDGQSAYASAITPYKGSATQSPFVVLGSAT